MRSRLRMTLLLLLGALGSGLLFLALEFGRTEGRTRIFDVDSEHYDREQQQQHRQHDVLPGDFKSADRGPLSWPAWTRMPKIWNSNKNGEIKTYPNLAQCQIFHHREPSANIMDISLLLDPKRFSRFRNIFDARCSSLHQSLLTHLKAQQSKELLKGFVCGSHGSWKTSVFFKVLEEDVGIMKGVLRDWAPEVRWKEEGVCEKGVMGSGGVDEHEGEDDDDVLAVREADSTSSASFIGSNHNGKEHNVKPMERRGQSQSTGSRPSSRRIHGKCLVTDTGATFFDQRRYTFEVYHPTKRLDLQATCRSLQRIVKRKSHSPPGDDECTSFANGKGVYFATFGDKVKPLHLHGLTDDLVRKFPFNEWQCRETPPRYNAERPPPDYIDVAFESQRRTGCLVSKHTFIDRPDLELTKVNAMIPGIPHSDAECERARAIWRREYHHFDGLWMCKEITGSSTLMNGGIFMSAMAPLGLQSDLNRASRLLQEAWPGQRFDCSHGD